MLPDNKAKEIISEFLSFGVMLFIIAMGWLIAQNFDANLLHKNTYYPIILNILLGIGLYASVREINLNIAANDKKTLISVITLGVFIKVLIIGLGLFLITGELSSFLFAVIVAQIDPLSVGSLINNNKDRLSIRGKNILLAWASFDDPITIILAILIAKYIVNINVTISDLPQYAQAFNLIIPIIAYQVHKLSNSNLIMSITLLILFVISAYYGFMLSIAISALFVRPKLFIKTKYIVNFAYFISLIIFGTYLVDKIDIEKGIYLALGAIVSQIIVSLMFTWNFENKDRIYLAFAQQNGITAVILALLFANYIEGIVPIIAVAIIIINMIHLISFSIIENILKINTTVK